MLHSIGHAMKIILSLITSFTATCLFGQIKDTVQLKRYRFGQDVEYYNLPLTTLSIIRGAYQPKNDYYFLRRDFERKSRTNLLFIEKEQRAIPKKESWDDDYYLGLQLTLEIPDKGEKEINIVLGNNGKRLKVKNQFATQKDKTYFFKTDKKGRQSLGRIPGTQTVVSGQLKIEKGEDYLITGVIDVKSQNPLTLQRIIFSKNKVVNLTFDEFTKMEEEKYKRAEEISDKQTEIFVKILKEKKKFYDSIFSNEKYPKNHLTASFDNSKFDYKLNKGYVMPNSAINSKSGAADVFTNDLFQTMEGKNYLFTLNHFSDPDTTGIDDETIYSVLIELPTITTGVNDFSETNSFAKLGYWHFGAFGHIVESNQYTGQLVITESTDKTVSGTLNISFKDADNKDFLLSGGFQLPIVTRETFDSLKKRLEKIAPQK